MRPLPRLHAITDRRVIARDDLGVRAAAIAAAGPAVALHARAPGAGARTVTGLAQRLLALARPPEAAVLVNGHPDIARALHAAGVHLAATDLAPGDARRVLGEGWVGQSVHSLEQAAAAAEAGADYLMLGNIFPTTSHPGRLPLGLDALGACARLGPPVIAIGGITAERAAAVRDAGAWGLAAVSALWDAADPAAAALALLEPWNVPMENAP